MIKIFITISLIMYGYSSAVQAGNSSGASSSKKWDASSICSTARMMAKNSLSKSQKDYIYKNKCTVVKLTAPLPGSFSHYRPYAATWENGVALRAFETDKGLKLMGISKDGIPFQWNKNHKPIKKDVSYYENECSKLFVKKTSAKNIKITNSKKYSDLSGAVVNIKYIGKGNINTVGTCIFDRKKMTMATSKVKADQYSKYIYKNY